MIIKMVTGQSIADVALQYCGSVEYVFDVAELNGVAIDYVAERELQLLVPDVDNMIKTRLNRRGVVICTGRE